MNKLNQETNSESLVCNTCSYDANPKHLTTCEICGTPLSLPSEVNKSRKQQLSQQLRSKYSLLKQTKFLLPLILLLITGGGFFFTLINFLLKIRQIKRLAPVKIIRINSYKK